MIGRSPRRNRSGSSSLNPTRTGPTYTILHLWIRGFELPQPTESNQPPISLLAHGCTRKLQNKEANHFLLIPGCLSDVDIPSIDTTVVPTATHIQGPITRSRAKQLNY